MTLRQMIDGNTSALREYEAEQSRAAAWDAFLDECREEIKADIAKGLPLQCNGYTLDPQDFALFCVEHNDGDTTLLAFLAGNLGADEYKRWLNARLDDFACRHMLARAEWVRD